MTDDYSNHKQEIKEKTKNFFRKRYDGGSDFKGIIGDKTCFLTSLRQFYTLDLQI